MRAFVGLSVVILFGCGRIGFESVASDGGIDGGSGDAATDAAPDAVVDASGDGALVADVGFCDQSPCRYVEPQCGCIAGAACYPAGTESRCVVAGDTALGEPCFMHADCAPGLGCLANGPDGARLCRRLCQRSFECPNGACLANSSEVSGACEDGCDPLANTGCTEGFGCYVLTAMRIEDRASISVSLCITEGTVAEGDPCDPTNLCAPGHVCEGSTETCVPLCTVGGVCGPPYTFCEPSGLFIGGVEAGVCRM